MEVWNIALCFGSLEYFLGGAASQASYPLQILSQSDFILFLMNVPKLILSQKNLKDKN